MGFVARDFEYNGEKVIGIILKNVYEGDVLCDERTIYEIDYFLFQECKFDGMFYNLIEECKNTFSIIKGGEHPHVELYVNFNTEEDRDTFIEKINNWIILEKLTG